MAVQVDQKKMGIEVVRGNELSELPLISSPASLLCQKVNIEYLNDWNVLHFFLLSLSPSPLLSCIFIVLRYSVYLI